MAQSNRRTPLGARAAISLAGLGIPLLLWVLGELKVHLPTIILYGLLALAVVLIVGPWIIISIQRRRRQSAGSDSPDPPNEVSDTHVDQSVTSYDQSGGITAHSVTMGSGEQEDQDDPE